MTTPLSVDVTIGDVALDDYANPADLPRARRLGMVLRRAASVFDNALMPSATALCLEAAVTIDALDDEVRSLSTDLLDGDTDA